MKRTRHVILVISLLLVMVALIAAGCTKPAPSTSAVPTSQAAATQAPAAATSAAPAKTSAAPVATTTTAAKPSAPAPAGQIVWKMDWFLAPSDPETVMLQQACDEVLEYTEGGLKIELYPAFSLKLPMTKLTNLKNGVNDIASNNVGMIEGEEPSFGMTEGVGIWDSKDNQAKAVEAMAPFKTKVYAEVWNSKYIATNMMAVQRNGVFATKKIATLDDLKGLKLRVSSASDMDPYKALGAAPVTMSAGDVYMSIKTGVLDGASSGARMLIYSKWGEVCKYGVENSLSDAVAMDVAVSNKAWNAIPKGYQDVVLMVFKALEKKHFAMATMPGTSDHFVRAATTMGVQFLKWSDADQTKFINVFKDVVVKEVTGATSAREKEAWAIAKPFTNVK